MMRSHATPDEIRALRRRALDPATVLDLTRHLGSCAACRALAGEQVSASPASPHPDLETELFVYVDGSADDLTLGAGQWEAIDEHVRDCARCREDVADLRSERLAMTPAPRQPGHVLRRASPWIGLAAAAVIGLVFILPTPDRAVSPAAQPHSAHVTPAAPPQRRSDWESLVRAALQNGRIDPPATIRGLREQSENLRGAGDPKHAALAPTALVVAVTQPRFSWPSNGETAVVSVFDGPNLVAQSAPVKGSEWTPGQPLRRGRVYAWQVELTSAGGRRIVPLPPDPPAQFGIVDAPAWQAIEEARRARPGDHLLLGILEARAGLKREALDDLTQAGAPAGPLAASVRAW
jgi:hypothetical protein